MLSKIKSVSSGKLNAGFAIFLLLLSGCASVSDVEPGTPVAEVVKKYGRPSVSCSMPDGSRRMVWTQMPMGEAAYALNVGADNTVGAPEQVLSDAHFQILANGQKWTPEALRCEFGPPASVTESGMGNSKQWVWGYRYMRGSDAIMMYVYMGHDGRQVTHFGAAPDPLFNDEVTGGRR